LPGGGGDKAAFFSLVGDSGFYALSLLILCSNFFLLFKKRVLIGSNGSNYSITIHPKFPAQLTLPSHHVTAMFFIPFGNCGFSPEDRERRRKKVRE
jgi:hypothetical protein